MTWEKVFMQGDRGFALPGSSEASVSTPETPRTWTLEGASFHGRGVDRIGKPRSFSGPAVGKGEKIEVVEKAPVDAERERLLDLLRIAALTNVDSGLVPEDHECDDLFQKGLVANRRDICDEYETVLTDEGRDAIRIALREYGRLGKGES